MSWVKKEKAELEMARPGLYYFHLSPRPRNIDMPIHSLNLNTDVVSPACPSCADVDRKFERISCVTAMEKCCCTTAFPGDLLSRLFLLHESCSSSLS